MVALSVCGDGILMNGSQRSSGESSQISSSLFLSFLKHSQQDFNNLHWFISDGMLIVVGLGRHIQS